MKVGYWSFTSSMVTVNSASADCGGSPMSVATTTMLKTPPSSQSTSPPTYTSPETEST